MNRIEIGYLGSTSFSIDIWENGRLRSIYYSKIPYIHFVSGDIRLDFVINEEANAQD